MEATITDNFTYNGSSVKAEWFDVLSKNDLPCLAWRQVYAVGNLGGKVPLVYYSDGHFSLPGGKTEPGESVEETLCREIREELNCRVVSWSPLGYQKNSVGDSYDGYQLRVYAQLEKIGDFESDPAGSVVGHKLIKIDKLSETIRWGKISDHLQKLTRNNF